MVLWLKWGCGLAVWLKLGCGGAVCRGNLVPGLARGLVGEFQPRSRDLYLSERVLVKFPPCSCSSSVSTCIAPIMT